MALLTLSVLLPTLQDPSSRIYSSKSGYPAWRRGQGKAIQSKTAVVKLDSKSQSIGAPGESVAFHEVDVRPEISGRIRKVWVAPGDRVQQGQLLMQLEPQDAQHEVAQAEAALKQSQARLRSLQIAAEGEIELLRDQLKSAQRRLSAAESRVNDNESYITSQAQREQAAATIQLRNAKQRLAQMEALQAQGAISQFQLLDAQDVYAQSLGEFEAAEQGVFFDRNSKFVSQDFYLEREQDVITAEQQLATRQRVRQAELEAARLEVSQHQIALEEALQTLERTRVYATTNGLISRVDVDAGDYYELDDRKALITLSTHVEFQAFVDQVRLHAVQPGDTATVRLVSYPGQTFVGQVKRVNPTVETEGFRLGRQEITNQYTYSVWIDVPELEMAPGLQGFAQFSPQQASLMVPESAVTHLSGGEGLVLVVEDGKTVTRPVQLGERLDNQRRIVGGIKEGEEVVLQPKGLRPGDEVQGQKEQTDEVQGG